jgi:hypothetical protein
MRKEVRYGDAQFPAGNRQWLNQSMSTAASDIAAGDLDGCGRTHCSVINCTVSDKSQVTAACGEPRCIVRQGCACTVLHLLEGSWVWLLYVESSCIYFAQQVTGSWLSSDS